MEKFAVTALLLIALALPVVLFWFLRSRFRLGILFAAGIAVAAGWAFNLAYAFAVQALDPLQVDASTLKIAGAFGWVCPTVLVFLSWLVWRLATRRRTGSPG